MENNTQKPIDRWAIPFAAWELRLYLDTHPDDEKALEAYRKVCDMLEVSGMNCGACLPNEMAQGKHWSWIDEPWPWQPEANDTGSREV